jgi:hypothetical protein
VLAERDRAALRRVAEARCPVVLVGTRSWDPSWARAVPLILTAPALSRDARDAVWREVLNGSVANGFDPTLVTAPFRLSPERIVRVAIAARQRADAANRPLGADDLRAGARAQNASGLEHLARRVAPVATWDDIVLDSWRMGGRGVRGRGVTALFAGESGTGKTLAAEVVAGALGLDLYVIDLSSVVDKYIGETEKNLERIFTEADRVNGVLLFDEADAIFGKRSEVSDAHDRYANVETAYLLQRMERFDGLAVLTTNLRANIDDAFLRRLDAVVDFPMPEEDDRRREWDLHLPATAPRADDVDLDFLAHRFRLSGGNIRNIALGAAFLAADDDAAVGMAHLVRATEREYRKLGRLCTPEEFGEWYQRARE